MKKLILAVLAASLLSGCADSASWQQALQAGANYGAAYAANGGDPMRAAVGDSTYYPQEQVQPVVAPAVTTHCTQSPLGFNSMGGSITCTSY